MSQACKSLMQTEFVAFDLETTGLHPVVSQIVEIGAVRFRGDGLVLGCIQQLVNPLCRIPADVSKIHGITDDMVVGQPTISEALPRLIEFFGESTTILIAHNAGFDMGFLAMAFSRLCQPCPTHQVFDSCALAKRCLRSANYKLETIGRQLGLIEREEHRALDDALLLKDVFIRIVQRTPSLGSSSDLCHMVAPASFESFTEMRTKPPAGYEELWRAIEIQQPLEIVYIGGENPGTTRVVTPLGLITMRGQIYLKVYCHRRDSERTYRLDRIVSYRSIACEEEES